MSLTVPPGATALVDLLGDLKGAKVVKGQEYCRTMTTHSPALIAVSGEFEFFAEGS